MFTKVLAPLDQSSFAEQSLDVAAAIAHASGGEIELVLAHPPGISTTHSTACESGQRDPEQYIYMNVQTERVAAKTGLEVTSRIEVGAPVETICRRAREIDADLIVMSSHGRTGFGRACLGSVADGVVRRASAPVLMLRATERTAGLRTQERLFRRILVALDGSEESAAVLPAAVNLAHCSAGTLILTRVVVPRKIVECNLATAPYPVPIVDRESTRMVAAASRIELADLADRLQTRHGLRVEIAVRVSEHPATAIAQLARVRGADLIALTTHGRGRTRLVVESVTDKILRASPLPLLLARAVEDGSPDVGERPVKASVSRQPRL